MSNTGLTPTDMNERFAAGLKKRYRAEKRMRAYGLAAILFSLSSLAILLLFIISIGWSAFQQTVIRLDISLEESVIDPDGGRDLEVLRRADYQGLIRQSLRDLFPDVVGRQDKRRLYKLISAGAQYDLRDQIMADPDMIGTDQTLWVLGSSDADMWQKGKLGDETVDDVGRLNEQQVKWLLVLRENGFIKTQFNTTFFSNGDSREPELAGIWGAVIGAFLSLSVTLILSFPLGVLTAVYLEELAPKNRWTRLIEININNLAAIPSIIFGLLGLAVFLNFFGFPRSSPLVGGMVLALMTLPTIVIAARASLQAIPPSIREAALAVGASPLQMIFHHVVPLALPGMLTGTIIGMAQALGETAPLLMIGMLAFIVDIPQGFVDSASTLPVQVYLWADSAERGFVEKTGAAIMVLLAFLVAMNSLAIFIRHKFERKW